MLGGTPCWTGKDSVDGNLIVIDNGEAYFTDGLHAPRYDLLQRGDVLSTAVWIDAT
jgi:hypothetical protein